MNGCYDTNYKLGDPCYVAKDTTTLCLVGCHIYFNKKTVKKKERNGAWVLPTCEQNLEPSRLVNLVFSCQTGFLCASILFIDKPMFIREPTVPNARIFSLQKQLSLPSPLRVVSLGGTSAHQRQIFHTDDVKSVRNLVRSADWSTQQIYCFSFCLRTTDKCQKATKVKCKHDGSTTSSQYPSLVKSDQWSIINAAF